MKDLLETSCELCVAANALRFTGKLLLRCIKKHTYLRLRKSVQVNK